VNNLIKKVPFSYGNTLIFPSYRALPGQKNYLHNAFASLKDYSMQQSFTDQINQLENEILRLKDTYREP
jgi:hypothetical protein